MEGIIRGLSVPLGYVIGTMFPEGHAAAYMIATPIANAIIDLILLLFVKINYIPAFMQKKQVITVTQDFRKCQISAFMLELFPDQISGHFELKDKAGFVAIANNAKIIVAGIHIVVNTVAGEAHDLELTCPMEANINTILDAFTSFAPKKVVLRFYNLRQRDKEITTTLTVEENLANMDNTFFSAKVMTELVDDMNGFITGKQRYIDRGRPYQRNYLVHGPPGSGKTSSVRVVLGRFKIFNVPPSLLFKNPAGVTAVIRENVSPGEIYVVIIDEIEAEFNRIWGSDKKLAVFLDGAMPSSGRIVIMTGNDVSSITGNEMLVRDGRIDKIVEMDYVDREQFVRTVRHANPDFVDDGYCIDGLTISALNRLVNGGLEDLRIKPEEEKLDSSINLKKKKVRPPGCDEMSTAALIERCDMVSEFLTTLRLCSDTSNTTGFLWRLLEKFEDHFRELCDGIDPDDDDILSSRIENAWDKIYRPAKIALDDRMYSDEDAAAYSKANYMKRHAEIQRCYALLK